MDKYINLAKKIYTLSKNGVGGEKSNAEKILNDFLEKHNISIEDLENEELGDYFFNLEKNDYELWNQIVSKVNRTIKRYGKFPIKAIKSLGFQGNYFITCTAAEYVEIESMYIHYKKLYKEELSVFFYAFCDANDLLVNANENDSQELSEKEEEELIRAMKMARSIKKESFRRQLN